jgi:cephalosporin-C deacetylase-like acetyl esterase
MISAPEDYGLSPEQTLTREADDDLPEGFHAYWKETREAVASLSPHFRGSIDGPVSRIEFESYRSVRIVGRVELPAETPRGAVITTHGSDPPDDFEGGDERVEPWTPRGLISLRIRVRGFPPSTIDVDDLRGSWILHNIESADAWIMRGAVVDVMQAYRCLRRRFGDSMPISLHGESFGGGLAVIAAAQLSMLNPADVPFRLAIGLPSFGDWRWRCQHYCNGAGGLINAYLDFMRGERDRMVRTLRLFDASLHARTVDAPTVCKLAQRDDVVPAPSAAAVYNALATRRKCQFITKWGHFDGGLANARRHLAFERVQSTFLDPATDETMMDSISVDRAIL